MGSEPTSLALSSRGAGCLSGVRLEQVTLAELDILLYFYLGLIRWSLGTCNCFCLGVPSFFFWERSIQLECFFLLRDIYSARMSTSEFGSIILLNKQSLHLISVDPIWKLEIVWCESQETKVNAVRHIFNSFASCRCFKKNILHWALKETNYRSISDEYRCDFTVIYLFFGLE